MGLAAEVSRARYRGPTTARYALVTVATTGTRILLHNADRVHWSIANRDGSNFFEAAIGALVAAGSGERVQSVTGRISKDVEQDGESVTQEVWGRADTASITVWVEEIIRLPFASALAGAAP